MRNLLIVVLFSLVCISCETGNQPPVAKLEAFPSIGDTSIIFEFNAGESEDDRNLPKGLTFRWDIDGDGEWDTDYFENNSIAHKYEQPGTYVVAVEVMDLDGLTSIAKDSIEAFGENLDIDTLYDSRDGNRYRIVKIKGSWWMAENLRYGVLIPSSLEQTNNDTVERYRFSLYDVMDTVGGVYRWLEAMNYQIKESQGICPDGWHLPTDNEWGGLFKSYPHNYCLNYYGKEGLSKLNLDLNCYGERWPDGNFWELPHYGGFWSSSFDTDVTGYQPYVVIFDSQVRILSAACHQQSGPENKWENTSYFSVRCVKNQY